MKTNDLIALLARDGATLAPVVSHKKTWAGIVAGLAISFALMLLWLGLNPELMQDALSEPMFAIKAAFTAGLMFAFAFAAVRLVTPGRATRAPLAVAALIMVGMSLLGVRAAFNDASLSDALFAVSWNECSMFVSVLSLPIFVATLWAMRRYAPTQLTFAGFVAGAFAGAAGATIYGLHCSQYDASFVAVWYSLGVLIPGVIGAALGKVLLRW